jgi:hypothetical protein
VYIPNPSTQRLKMNLQSIFQINTLQVKDQLIEEEDNKKQEAESHTSNNKTNHLKLQLECQMKSKK